MNTSQAALSSARGCWLVSVPAAVQAPPNRGSASVQDLKRPGRQWRVEREYGSLQPQRLWNASYATGPNKWTVGSLEAMCDALAPVHVHSIAIVGNGPLTTHFSSPLTNISEQHRHLLMVNSYSVPA